MRTITHICLVGSIFFILPSVNAAMAQSMTATPIMTEPSARTERIAERPREAASLFISGHSLIDQPIPDYLAEIARSLDTPLQWNRQYMVGSSILARTRGLNAKASGWQGYRSGYNRRGEGLDVIEELRRPKTIQSKSYDALVITEQHGLLGSLNWNNTVRYLRHYHERLIEGNPQATTYFYESWLGMNDKNNPQRWIAYERAASPVWQCIATRINVSLAAEGRPDRILSLPAGLAMAELLDRATQPAGLPGITRGSVRETVDGILSDNVHNTELGKYYAALVTYSVVYRRSPQGAWRPKGVSAVQAESLQRQAWDFVSNYTNTNVPLSLAQCREYLQESFINLYWSYTRDTYWRNEVSSTRAHIRWARQVANWHWLVRRDNTENPFYFDPSTDRHFWLQAP